MSDLRFSVKDKSLNQFFIDNGIDYRPNGRNPMDDSPYYLMKDELFIKKAGFETDQLIEFELLDFGQNSRKELINKYVYRITQYDDISFKLVLESFQIQSK